MSIRDDLERAELEVARLRRKLAQSSCLESGHVWKFSGARNVGCVPDCCCGVSVNVCEKCGECDYGENAELDEILRTCQERVELESNQERNTDA